MGLVNVLTGSRPTTLDSFPLLGKLKDFNIYVATGTKRDELLLLSLLVIL